MDSPSSSSSHPPSSSSSSSGWHGHRPRRMSSTPVTTQQQKPQNSFSSSSSFPPLPSSFSSSSIIPPRRLPSSVLLLVITTLLISVQNGFCMISFFSPDDLKYTFGVDHLSRVPPHRLVTPRLIARPRRVRPDDPLFDLYLQMADDEQPLLLPLHSITDQLLADQLTVVRRTRPDGGGHFSLGRESRAMVDDCHFHHQSEHILAAISNCDGLELKGTIIRNGSVHVLHPIPAHHFPRVRRSTSDGATTATALHVLYRRDAVATVKNGTGEDFCGIENTISSDEMAENEAGIHEDAFVVGQRLMREGELTVELAVFVDEQLWRHFSSKYGAYAWQKLQQYTLTMLSNIQIMYRQPTSVPSLTFRVVRYEVYQTQPSAIASYLHENGNAQHYLDLFCRYQRNLGAREWDHALMLTGFDIHRGYGATSISGIARLDGMCDSWNSCTLAEGLDFTSAFIGTHELGHAVGMRHDEPYCPGTHIMSASLGPGKVTWSSCSTRDYQMFIQRLDARQNNCMRSSLLREQLPITESAKPGQVYDAHEQCRLMHGPSYVQVSPRHDHYDGVCHMMWCGQSNYGRIITSHPALEGTVCGTNQWCSLGRCVPWGSGGGGFATPLAPRPPLQPQPVATVPMLTTVVPATTSQVDGQWSEWSPFECHQCFCSEISGAIGVTLSERNCSNPAPQNGGAECSGPAHRAAVCSHKCPQERQSVNQYISAKCTEHQRVRQDPELTGTGSQLTRFPQRACKVFCDVKNEDGAPRNYRFYGDDLPDGAPCGWNRYCLNGECTIVHKYFWRDCLRQQTIMTSAGTVATPAPFRRVSNGEKSPSDSDRRVLSDGETLSDSDQRVLSDGESLSDSDRRVKGDGESPSGSDGESPSGSDGESPSGSDRNILSDGESRILSDGDSPTGGSDRRILRDGESPSDNDRRVLSESPNDAGDFGIPSGVVVGPKRWRDLLALSCDSSLLLIAEYGEHCPAKEERCPTNAVDEPKTTAQLNVPRHFAIGQWEQWSSWSPCTASCGNAGVQFRSRVCPAGGRCDGGPSSESQPCNRISCPATLASDAAKWSEWSPWTRCSVSCGRGSQARYRRCTTTPSTLTQHTVSYTCSPGKSIEMRKCEEAPCEQQRRKYGQWTEWSVWSTCSSSCGPGSSVRTRTCTQEPCDGMSQQKLACNLKDCATWSQWGAWSDCSLLCGKGMRSRSRTCPAGSSCPGLAIEQQSCNEQPCDLLSAADSQAPLWSVWGEWGPCSVSCGNGVRRRTRACHRGSCPGSHFESAMCNEAECAVPDAAWGGWGYWSPCSEPCGAVGMRRRVRKCYGSGKCPGDDVQREQCVATAGDGGGEGHKCP
ncbi:hypothetical protein niasHT_005749 [Heterodera trifolii]|uniref:Peptidase M12B domain-containing protein n=1 Tax=Heterodera trifolii TaxID=157864 RepID=A0ABD2LYU1_9BILA